MSAQSPVDLISSDDEAAAPPPPTRDSDEAAAPPTRNSGKRATPTATPTAATSSAPGHKKHKATTSIVSPTPAAEDDEPVFQGSKGPLALADFPHARANCVVHPFAEGNEDKCFASCPNCYCYCCDTPVAACEEWEHHCQARHGVPRWDELRRAKAQEAKQQHAQHAAAIGGGGGASSSSGAAAPLLLSADELLTALEAVYPIETPEPPGLNPEIQLRPYQRQSLAFAEGRERSEDPMLLGRGGSVRGGFICDEMGMGKTAVCTSLILQCPLNATASSSKAKACPAKASTSKAPVVSGKVKSERPSTGGCGGSLTGPRRLLSGRKIKTTLVVVPNTLIGQWLDETVRFAPKLVTKVLYGTAAKDVTEANLADIDVLLTTPHSKFAFDVSSIIFHRLIVDESHSLDMSSKSGAVAWGGRQLDFLKSIQAPHVWLVTGTPFVLEGGRLTFDKQLELLGHATEGLALGGKPLTDRVVDDLKQLLIRHSKSQRIHGDVALALPEASLETVLIDMPPDERLLYDFAACSDGMPDWLHPQFPRPWVSEQPANLGRGIQHRLRCCANDFAKPANICGKVYDDGTNRAWAKTADQKRASVSSSSIAGPGSSASRPHPPAALDAYTRLVGVRAMEKVRQRAEWSKMKALLSELRALRAADPLARVVVFTQYDEVQQSVVQTLYREEMKHYTIFSFNKQTPVAVRHRLIREFQSPSANKGAAVCIATYQTAAVGITLTAASKVILMEPCLDPSLEAQAAGRIHRLGQQKEVLIRRFAYKGTVEEAIVDVHAAQRNGTLSVRDLQDCGGARSVTRNNSVKAVPSQVLDAFKDHGVHDPHRLATGPAAISHEPMRKDTGSMRLDPTTSHQETVWEWFVVQTTRCLDCGETVQLSGKCLFRGLASERAAKEAEIERCERRLRRVAEYKARLRTPEYRSGRKELTELQQREVDSEDWLTDRLETLNNKMIGPDGVQYYTHPAAAAAARAAGGGATSGHGSSSIHGGVNRAGAWADSEDGCSENEDYDDDPESAYRRRYGYGYGSSDSDAW